MKNIVSLLACWLSVLVCATAGQQLPPAQPPTFRTGVDAVQLDVSVLDKDRRPVRGLTAADFTVLEDGKPRPIVAFTAVELPSLPALPSTAAPGADTVPPDVTRNDLPDGRTVIILLDPFMERVMVPGRKTIADPPGLAALRNTALRVVDSLGPGDLAAVGHTIYGIAQNLTTDKSRLKRAIDTTAMGTIKRAEGEEWGSCECGVCGVEAITRVANAFRGDAQRRKTIFYVGERLRLSPVEGRCNPYLETATKQMVQATQLANVTVNTVDPNSLETTNVRAGDDFDPSRPISQAAADQEKANRAFLIERQQSLQTVADWTGGRAIMNTNTPEESVRPILDESSAYYLLAFQATDVKQDGRFHPIAVTVNRPGVQVRTRKGYYADSVTPAVGAGGTIVSLEAVSRALLPERGLPMSITAAPFRGSDGTPTVVITTGVRASTTPAASDSRAAAGASPVFEPIEILASAFRDGQKDVDWQRQRISIAIPETPPGQLRYEAISRVNVAPGTYELRVATRHEKAGDVGSVHAYVDVPDFSEGLTMSGVVLFDRRAPTATPPEALAGILETAPTTRRDFTAADEVSALVRVYQRQPPAAVTVAFRVLDGALQDVVAAQNALGAEQFAGAGAADARYALPLNQLKPGAYVLRIDAVTERTTGRRDVRFTVQ